MAKETGNQTPVETVVVEEEMVVGIGAELRQAREARRRSVSDVAAKLNLTKSVIDNLEVGAWDRLNGRTYARGYLNSYANFLGLSATDILAQFDQEYQEELPPLKARKRVAGKGYAKKNRRRFPWGKLILLGLIIVVIGFVYQQWPGIKAKVMSEMGMESNDAEILSSDIGGASPGSNITPQQVEQSDRENRAEQIGSNQVTALALPSLTAETPIIVDSDNSSGSNAVVSTPTESAIPVRSQQQIDPMQGTLALAFSGECWVEVKDANGKTLLNEIKKSGEQIVLIGKSPLQIALGDASRVKVRFNGALFNTQPFTSRGGVARFSLNNKQQ